MLRGRHRAIRLFVAVRPTVGRARQLAARFHLREESEGLHLRACQVARAPVLGERSLVRVQRGRSLERRVCDRTVMKPAAGRGPRQIQLEQGARAREKRGRPAGEGLSRRRHRLAIVREHGAAGVFRGFMSMALREAIYTGGYLGLAPVLSSQFSEMAAFENSP